MSERRQWANGPWEYEVDGFIGWFDVSSKNAPHIAEAIDNEANARLISAAPELYEALENCINQIKALCSADDVPDGAEAALSKARGEKS